MKYYRTKIFYFATLSLKKNHREKSTLLYAIVSFNGIHCTYVLNIILMCSVRILYTDVYCLSLTKVYTVLCLGCDTIYLPLREDTHKKVFYLVVGPLRV